MCRDKAGYRYLIGADIPSHINSADVLTVHIAVDQAGFESVVHI